MSISIRWAQLQDSDILHHIYYQERPKDDRSVDYHLEDFERLITSPERTRIIVALDELYITGFLLAYDMLMWCYVDVILVRKDYHNQGIGSLLLEFLHASANKRWWAIEVCAKETDSLSAFLDRHKYIKEPGNFTWRYRRLDSER